jgi:hypothetical protein
MYNTRDFDGKSDANQASATGQDRMTSAIICPRPYSRRDTGMVNNMLWAGGQRRQIRESSPLLAFQRDQRPNLRGAHLWMDARLPMSSLLWPVRKTAACCRVLSGAGTPMRPCLLQTSAPNSKLSAPKHIPRRCCKHRSTFCQVGRESCAYGRTTVQYEYCQSFDSVRVRLP